MTRYAGIRAAVLGAAGDIGLAVAKRLVEGGAEVVLAAGAGYEGVDVRAELGSAARTVAPGELKAGLGADVDVVFGDSVAEVRPLLRGLRDGGAVVFTGPADGIEELAAELAVRSVRVNAVAPGCIAAQGGATAPLPPLGRLGSAEEVARVALFLATEATFTTGARIPVAGGRHHQ